MTTDLFRKVALERLSTPEQLDQALALSPVANRLALYLTFAVVMAILFASVVVSVPIMAKGVGIVLAAEGVGEVSAQHSGRVQQVRVKPGDTIAVGQPIADLFQPDQENSLRTLRAELADASNQRRRIVEFHARDSQVQTAQRVQRKRELEQRAMSTRQRLKWMEDRQQQDETLVARGFLSRNRLQDTRTEYLQTQDRLAEIDSQLRTLEVEETASAHARQRETLDLDLRIASIEHRIGELSDKLARESVALSQHAGIVAETKVNVGDVVGPGSPLVTLLPNEGAVARTPAVIAYLAAGEAKKVRPSMGARVTPGSIKKEEYGSIVASVTTVSPMPATQEGMQRVLRNRQLVQTLSQNVAPIEILLALQTDERSPSGLRWTSRGPAQKIDVGTTVEVEVVVKRMRLIVLALPALERWLAVDADAGGQWPFDGR